uniref:Uncharacterized protein n=1 Tax=Micrurus carvalhoi TaxID=3147026 RepID=A0A2H6NF11_9SAUR
MCWEESFTLLFFLTSHHQGGSEPQKYLFLGVALTLHQKLTRRSLKIKITTGGIMNKPGVPVPKTTIPFLLHSMFLQLFSMKSTCKAEEPLQLTFYTAFVTALLERKVPLWFVLSSRGEQS